MTISRQTTIRLSAELAEAIEAEADRRGMGQSEFIRYAVRVLLDGLVEDHPKRKKGNR